MSRRNRRRPGHGARFIDDIKRFPIDETARRVTSRSEKWCTPGSVPASKPLEDHQRLRGLADVASLSRKCRAALQDDRFYRMAVGASLEPEVGYLILADRLAGMMRRLGFSEDAIDEACGMEAWARDLLTMTVHERRRRDPWYEPLDEPHEVRLAKGMRIVARYRHWLDRGSTSLTEAIESLGGLDWLEHALTEPGLPLP